MDYRPHIHDPVHNLLLVDSGSAVCCFPPDPGDQAVEGSYLKAVNGTQIKCYGQKEFTIKLGRKPFKFKAFKADVDTPIIGWDFIRHYRLHTVWNEFGDVFLEDPKSKCKSILLFKALHINKSLSMKDLCRIDHQGQESSRHPSFDLPAQIAAILELGELNKVVFRR